MPADALKELHCYWAEPGVLLAGEYPGGANVAETEARLEALIAAGVRVFLDLTEPGELPPYDGVLADLADEAGVEIQYARHPIEEFAAPGAPEQMHAILGAIEGARANGVVAYVHCRGGIGRTGTVVGCLLREQGLGGEEALARIVELRAGSSKDHWDSPEREAQREWVRRWSRP